MEREKKNRPKIVAVVVAVVLIVALIVGMVSCSSGKATDPTDGTGEQLEHYPVGVVTKPTEGGDEVEEPVMGTEPIGATEGNGNGETVPAETTETAETTKPTEPKPTEAPKPTNPAKPTEPKPTDPVKPTDPKSTEPAPTEPKPTVPTPTEPKPTEPHAHSFSWVVQREPSCMEDGYRTGKCTVCGYCTSEYISRLGHEYRDVVTKPTCTEKGYTRQVCARCGEDSGSIFNFTQPIGHSYNGKVTTPATCSQKGTKTYTCSICSASYTESIPTTEHSWVHHHEDAEGYDEVGIECRCGWVVWESEVESSGYDMYTYYILFHVKQFESDKGHSYDEIMRTIITKPAEDYDICSVCGKRS